MSVKRRQLLQHILAQVRPSVLGMELTHRLEKRTVANVVRCDEPRRHDTHAIRRRPLVTGAAVDELLTVAGLRPPLAAYARPV